MQKLFQAMPPNQNPEQIARDRIGLRHRRLLPGRLRLHQQPGQLQAGQGPESLPQKPNLQCYHPANRHQRTPTWDAANNPEGRWRRYSYEELIARDKTSLDLFWLKDKSLTDLDNLPEPDDLAEEIIENLEAGLDSFRQVLVGLKTP